MCKKLHKCASFYLLTQKLAGCICGARCDICDKKLSTEHGLRTHVVNVHHHVTSKDLPYHVRTSDWVENQPADEVRDCARRTWLWSSASPEQQRATRKAQRSRARIKKNAAARLKAAEASAKKKKSPKRHRRPSKSAPKARHGSKRRYVVDSGGSDGDDSDDGSEYSESSQDPEPEPKRRRRQRS